MHGANLPATALELLLVMTLFPSAFCEEADFSGGSGRIVKPDGTKAARSGG